MAVCEGAEDKGQAHCSNTSCMRERHDSDIIGCRSQMVQDLVSPVKEDRQAPLSMGFSRQGCWSTLPFPPPGDLPDPGIKPVSPEAPAWQADSLPLSHWGSPLSVKQIIK